MVNTPARGGHTPERLARKRLNLEFSPLLRSPTKEFKPRKTSLNGQNSAAWPNLRPESADSDDVFAAQAAPLAEKSRNIPDTMPRPKTGPAAHENVSAQEGLLPFDTEPGNDTSMHGNYEPPELRTSSSDDAETRQIRKILKDAPRFSSPSKPGTTPVEPNPQISSSWGAATARERAAGATGVTATTNGTTNSSNLPLREQDRLIEELRSEIFNLQLKIHVYDKRLEENVPLDAQTVVRENIHLNEILIAKQNEVEEMRQELEDSSGRVLEEEYEAYIGQVEALQSKSREREALLSEREVAIQNLESGLLKKSELIQAQRSTIADLETRISLETSSHERVVNERVSRAQTDLEESKRQLSALQANVTSLTEETRRLSRELDAARQTASSTALAHQERVQNLQHQLESERVNTREAVTKQSELQLKIDSFNAQRSLLEHKMEAERSTARAAEDSTRAQLEEMRRQVVVKDSELQTLRGTAYTAQSEAENLKKQLANDKVEEARLVSKLERLQVSHDALRTELDLAKKDTTSSFKNASGLQTEIVGHKETIAKLSAELKQVSQDREKQRQLVRELTQTVEGLRTTRSENERTSSADAQRLQTQITELTMRLAQVSSEHDKLSDRAKRAEEAHRDSLRRNKDQEQVLVDLQSELLALKNKNRALTGQNANLEQQLETSNFRSERPPTRDFTVELREESLARQVETLRKENEDQRTTWKRLNDQLVDESKRLRDQLSEAEASLRSKVLAEPHYAQANANDGLLANEIVQTERRRFQERLDLQARELEATILAAQETNRNLEEARTSARIYHGDLLKSQLQIKRLEDIVARAEGELGDRATELNSLKEATVYANSRLEQVARQLSDAQKSDKEARLRVQAVEQELDQVRSEAKARFDQLASDSEGRSRQDHQFAEQQLRDAIAARDEAAQTARTMVEQAKRDAETRIQGATAEAEHQLAAKMQELKAYHERDTARQLAKAVEPLDKELRKAVNAFELVLQYHCESEDRMRTVVDDLVFYKNYAKKRLEQDDQYSSLILKGHGFLDRPKRTFGGVASMVLAMVRMRKQRRPAVSPKVQRRFNRLMAS